MYGNELCKGFCCSRGSSVMSTRRTQDKQWTELPGVKSNASKEISLAAIVSNHP